MQKNGLLTSILPPQAMQPPQLVVAQPFNDVQFLALVAAQLSADVSPRERVRQAVELTAEAILAVEGGAIKARVAVIKSAEKID